MTVVGHLDACDPSNPFGLGFFLLRNFWGPPWDARNPMGEPGHALVPEAYLARRDLLIEAANCIDTS